MAGMIVWLGFAESHFKYWMYNRFSILFLCSSICDAWMRTDNTNILIAYLWKRLNNTKLQIFLRFQAATFLWLIWRPVWKYNNYKYKVYLLLVYSTRVWITVNLIQLFETFIHFPSMKTVKENALTFYAKYIFTNLLKAMTTAQSHLSPVWLRAKRKLILTSH